MTARTAGETLRVLSALTERLGRCAHLDEVITTSLDALDDMFGFEHSSLLLLDESGRSLFTIASRGFEPAGIGSEVAVGEGVLGTVAVSGRAMRVGNLQRILLYARSARPSDGDREIALPSLPAANSQLAAPATVLGETIGVLAVESERLGAFTPDDESLLTVVAHVVGTAIELDRVGAASAGQRGQPTSAATRPARMGSTGAGRCVVRFYPSDGSTFLDGDYLIKGVAGRILWKLLVERVESGRTEFTNREIRLDPGVELPAYRDNLESRLILLKRRLVERGAPIRVVPVARGRFRVEVDGIATLESIDGAA